MRRIIAVFLSFLIALMISFGLVTPAAFATGTEIKVVMDGEELKFEKPPVIYEGRVMAPLQEMAEKLGAKVEFLDGKIKVSRNNDVFYYYFLHTIINAFEVDRAGGYDYINGKNYVRLEVLTEGLGAENSWDENTKTLTIKWKSARYTPEQKKWALAAIAIYSDINGGCNDILGGGIPDEKMKKEVKDSLEQWWGVTDKASAKETLGWLMKEGHNKEFKYIASVVSKIDDATYQQLLAKTNNNRHLKFVKEHYKEAGAPGIAAWDSCRGINVVGECYYVGYLTADEAWEYNMSFARELQKSYGSWEEMCDSYMIGYEYWSGGKLDGGDERRESVVRLKNYPVSPWKRIPWNLSLEPEE
ncbi:MAG: DUF1266 domain-containing protein [Firmicutes bacterium]|nr:DUF1266 domain-containing protein [Bacillota bacterium]